MNYKKFADKERHEIYCAKNVYFILAKLGFKNWDLFKTNESKIFRFKNVEVHIIFYLKAIKYDGSEGGITIFDKDKDMGIESCDLSLFKYLKLFTRDRKINNILR